jgi:hypothetical protein
MTLGLGMLLALAGCGPDESTPQGQCRREAFNDPAVKDLQMRSLGGQSTAQELLPDLKDAENRATQRCLSARGLAPKGGVELEKPER